jgi:hypothetical protein
MADDNSDAGGRGIAGTKPGQDYRVGCTGLILIDAPSSAYRRGMLALGKQPTEEEETS